MVPPTDFVRHHLLALVIALVAAGSSWVLFAGVEHAPFHGDESVDFVRIYYSRLLSHGDFSREKWTAATARPGAP
jgi:hypothetical protein